MDIVSQASTTPFLVKLWAMLTDEGNTQAIAWDATGDLFEVRSPDLMSKKVLPQHFRHNNFSSFQRQLNYFGFKKTGKGEYGCLYQHEKFRRGFPELVLQIRRKTNSEHKVTGGGGQVVVKRNQTSKRATAKQENSAGRRQSARKRRTASAGDTNPYALSSFAYSYSPSNWTSKTDMLNEAEDSEESNSPHTVVASGDDRYTDSGTRRSKRMRLPRSAHNRNADGQTELEDHDEQGYREDTQEDTHTNGRNHRRQRVRSGSTQYMVTDITNVGPGPSVPARQEHQEMFASSTGYGNMGNELSHAHGSASPSLMNLGFGLDANEVENLMGYNVYSPAPPAPVPITYQAPVVQHQQHHHNQKQQAQMQHTKTEHSSSGRARGITPRRDSSSNSSTPRADPSTTLATSIAAAFLQENSNANQRSKDHAVSGAASGVMPSMVAGPVPAQPIAPCVPILSETGKPQEHTHANQQHSSQQQSNKQSNKQRDAASSDQCSNAHNKTDSSAPAPAPALAPARPGGAHVRQVQANSTMPITVPVPVRLPRSRSNSIECPQGAISAKLANKPPLSVNAGEAGGVNHDSAAVAVNATANVPTSTGADTNDSTGSDGNSSKDTKRVSVEAVSTVPRTQNQNQIQGERQASNSGYATPVGGTNGSITSNASTCQVGSGQHEPRPSLQSIPSQNSTVALGRPQLHTPTTSNSPHGAGRAGGANHPAVNAAVHRQRHAQTVENFSRQHMNMMRYYNHDPCLPPVSPFMFAPNMNMGR